ncbi:hypothetical protein CVT25_005093 [Psilocybe cyanescens]|uniref:BTB domain-containing protein n=1 Tax=Psilocybe cyanescens TaxID=93625 RepID=A0A409XE40_PSICY|nr:hypothetical protein CVT25_005093 [Psilocybe cyanescens]
MVSPTVKLNNRPTFSSKQATPSYVLVPVESLANSPTSSTGSASILDWNSNSDGELLQLSSPATLTATPSPPALSPSIVFSLPLADDSRLETPSSSSDLEDPFLAQWEMTPEQYTPFFDGLMAPAPICRGDSGVVVDDSTAPVDPVPLAHDPEAVKSISQLQPRYWEDFDRIKEECLFLSDGMHSPQADGGVDDSPNSTASCTNPDTSMTSTIRIPYLPGSSFSASMATTTKARNAIVTDTDPTPPTPVMEVAHNTITINMPSVMPPVPSTSTPPEPAKEDENAEAISIGEYLQRKAMSAEESAPRATTPHVEEIPSRPASTNSGLSYFTQPNSPVIANVEASTDGADDDDDSRNGHGSDSDAEGSIESTPSSPTPVKVTTPPDNISLTWRPAQIVAIPALEPSQRPSCMDDLLSRSTNNKSPSQRNSQITSLPGLFWRLPSPTGSYQDPQSAPSSPRYSPVQEFSAPASVCSSRASSPRAPILPSVNYAIRSAPIYGMAKGAGARARYSLSPEFPRRNLAGFPNHTARSPEFPRRTLDSDVPNISSLLNSVKISSQPEEDTPMAISRPLPRSAFSSSPASFQQEQELPKSPAPNIPQWLVNAAKCSQFSGATTSTAQKLRPPLPPVPVSKYDATPQFALRSDLVTRSPDNEPEYFAEALPSSWSTHLQGTPPPPPFSPQSNVEDNAWHSPAMSLDTPLQSAPADTLPTVTPFVHLGPYTYGNGWNWPYRDPALSTNVPMTNPSLVPRPPPHFYSPQQQRTPFHGHISAPAHAQYTGSTLPRDRKLPAPSSPNWDPPPRRLRFAPLPSSSGPYRLGVGLGEGPASAVSPYTPMPPMPPAAFYNNSYIYQTPLPHPPVIPQIFPNPPSTNVNATPAMSMSVFSNNTHPSSKKYWFADATVVFRVEDCLYRVHRHFFDRHSDTLSRMLATYWYDPTNHVYLPDVKKIEFERLLSIFYPTDLTKPDITTVSGWTSILALGKKWQMVQIKALAIQKLGPLTTAVEKISIAKKHAFSPNHEWLLPAYTELCSRRSPLSLEEAEELDLPTVMKIWEVQHNILNMIYRGMCSDSRIAELVKEKFGFTSYSFWEFGPDGAHI